MGLRVHRNLMWVRTDAERMDLLVEDPTIRKLLITRPDPELAGFLAKARPIVMRRLEQLGHAPREVAT